MKIETPTPIIRAQDLVLKERHKKKPDTFDLDYDVPEALWEKFLAYVLEIGDKSLQLEHKCNLAILHPNRVGELPKGKTDEIFVQGMMSYHLNMSVNVQELMSHAYGTKMVYPTTYPFPFSSFRAKLKDCLKTPVAKIARGGVYERVGVLFLLREWIITDPDGFNEQWSKDDNGLYVFKRDIERIMISDLHKAKNAGHWTSFAFFASAFRFVFPDAFHKIPLGKEEWRSLRKETMSAQASPVVLARLLSNMKILAAEEIHIRDWGLECVPHAKFEAVKDQPLPIIRSF